MGLGWVRCREYRENEEEEAYTNSLPITTTPLTLLPLADTDIDKQEAEN